MSEDNSREAFMAAVIKLADDEAFRRSFLEHYELWLHPPVLVAHDIDPRLLENLKPGHITYVDEDDLDRFRFMTASELQALRKGGGY